MTIATLAVDALQYDSRSLQCLQFPGLFVYEGGHSGFDAICAAAIRYEFCIKCEASVHRVHVQSRQDIIVRLHANQLAGAEIQVVRWRKLTSGYGPCLSGIRNAAPKRLNKVI